MAARIHTEDVIVLIPGIMGSVLERDGDVWALSPAAVLAAVRSGGGSLKALQLRQPNVDDGVRATRLFPDAHLIPRLWTIDGYSKIANEIQSRFDVTAGANYFEFPYDWRRDNRSATTELSQKATTWLETWRDGSGYRNARLALLCHSMGGLVARYFLECLDGWRGTRALITFGTPYQGSIQALDFLVNGYRVKAGPLTLFDFSEPVRTFPSVYQLLPTYPCLRTGAASLQRLSASSQVGAADQDLLADAIAFHRQIRAAVDAHRADNVYMTSGYSVYPIVGSDQATLVSAELFPDHADVFRDIPDANWKAGDGTVPWISAHPLDDVQGIETGDYFVERHGSLQNSDQVLTQVRNIVVGQQVDVARYRSVPKRGIGLDLRATYQPGERIAIRAQVEGPWALTVRLDDVVNQREVVPTRPMLLQADDSRAAVLDPGTLPAGIYRVTVSANGPVEPITELIAVLD